MKTEAEVLSALSERLSPGELAEVVSRILRVPEAWAYLHEAGVLERQFAASPMPTMTPWSLAADSLGMSETTADVHSRLPEPYESRLGLVSRGVLAPTDDVPDLETVALASISILRRTATPDGMQQVIKAICSEPSRWLSPLACAWPRLEDQDAILGVLVSGDKAVPAEFISNVLLANLKPDQAAAALIAASNESNIRLIAFLREIGATAPIDDEVRASDQANGSLVQAASERIRGNTAASRSVLDEAWESASELLATVSDHIADGAREDEESVVEIEARRQSLRTRPTPLRRAWLSEALTRGDRPDEAIALLSGPLTTIEEQIAATSAFLALGETTSASDHLGQITANKMDTGGLAPYWIRRLAAAAVACGQATTAIEIARRDVQLRPANPNTRLYLASLQAGAGDYFGAAGQARLVQALDPSDRQSLQFLAANLQRGGDPKSALPYWQALAASDPLHLEALADCALSSGDYSLAEEAARRALEFSGESSNAMVHLGRALLAQGDPQSALQHIEEATRLNPTSADAWIALAESQAAEGNRDSAGATLASAAQSIPSSGELQIAHSRWLRQAGRLSEALEVVQHAVNLSPGYAPWLIEQGELLRVLGHSEKALEVLKQAAHAWPGSWEARQALALTYDSAEMFEEAQAALGEVPDGASAESRFLAGRILVEAATSTGDTRRIPEALAIFDSFGPNDPNTDMWAARALALAGRAGDAIQVFLRCLPETVDEHTDLDHYLACVLGFSEAAIANDQPSLAISQLETTRSVMPGSAALLTGLSIAYQAAGLADQAIQAAEMACTLTPDQPAPLRQLAEVALQDGRWESALATLYRLALIEPESPRVRLDLARASLRAGDVQRSRDSLASALFSARRDPDVLRGAAGIMLEMGTTQSAKRMLHIAARLSDPDADLLAELAAASDVAEDFETALWAWRARVGLNPEDARALKGIASALDALGRRTEAIGSWEKALKFSPQDPAIPAILARAKLEAGEIPAAIDYYDLALERSPEDADLAVEAGHIQLRHGSPVAALAVLEPIVARFSERTDLLVALGEAYLRVDKPQKALEALQTAAQDPEASPACLALLALAQLANADLPGADASLDRALGTPPGSVDHVIQVSRAAMRLTRWEPAVGILEKWLATDDDPAAFREWIAARLRLADARYLYAHAAEASTHAPSPVWDGGTYLKDVQAAFARAERMGLEADEIASLNRRALAAAGVAGDSDFEALDEQALNDATGATSEGLAIAYLRAGHPVDAMRTMLPDPGKRPVGEWAALIIGIGQQAMGRHEQARQAFSYAASNPVLMPIAQYLAGRAFLTGGMKDKAIAQFNKALAAWPNEPSWHYRLAQEYLEIGDESSALPHLQHAVELAPRNGTYLLELARAYQAAGQLVESEGVYGRAVHAFPAAGEVWKEAGQLALALGKADHAESWFDQACRLSPDDPHCLVGAARAALALGRAREAREHTLAALQLAPGDPEVQMAMADVLAAQGKVDKALTAYDRALESASDPIPVRLARSDLLLRAGRAIEAAESLKSLTLTAGEDDRIWALLAEAARSAGDFEQAMNAAEHASRLSPRNTGYRLTLARISREAGHLDRALNELSQIDAGTSRDPDVAVEIGRLHEDRRELKHALDAYEHAIDLDPTSAEAHYRAGLVLKGLKAYEQAGAMLKRAVELNPRNPDVLHQLAAVRALELVHGGIRHMAVPR